MMTFSFSLEFSLHVIFSMHQIKKTLSIWCLLFYAILKEGFENLSLILKIVTNTISKPKQVH